MEIDVQNINVNLHSLAYKNKIYRYIWISQVPPASFFNLVMRFDLIDARMNYTSLML